MNREDFVRRFRGRLLVYLVEAWACRKEQPSDLGRLMDEQCVQLKNLLQEMYDAVHPPVGTNGHTPAATAAITGRK